MSHLSLGTVLAYPAISLPQLTSPQPSLSSVPVYTSIPDQDMLTFYQSNSTAQLAIQYERSSPTVDYSQTGELFTLQENPQNNTGKQVDGSSLPWNFFSNITLTPPQAAWFGEFMYVMLAYKLLGRTSRAPIGKINGTWFMLSISVFF